jgi:hypothetical protein
MEKLWEKEKKNLKIVGIFLFFFKKAVAAVPTDAKSSEKCENNYK